MIDVMVDRTGRVNVVEVELTVLVLELDFVVVERELDDEL